MDAQQQRLEVEPARADDDDLAVEDAALGQRGGERRDELREVAVHRLLVAALQQDLVAVAEDQRAKAVPLGLELPAVAVGQRLGGAGEHRLEGRSERQVHRDGRSRSQARFGTMSSFFILISSGSTVGTTCYDTPNRSLSQPHCTSSQPAESVDQK